MPNSNVFVLAGHGPYLNRGCEAIIRGTVRILRRHFENPQCVVVSAVRDTRGLDKQQRQQSDPAIRHEELWCCRRRFDTVWFATNVVRRTVPGYLKHLFYKNVRRHLQEARAVLAVGGDNYSLDYSRRPDLHTGLLDLVAQHEKSLIIWGASVGPFTKDPRFETCMSKRLAKAHILARESLTRKYLNQLGLGDNVHLVADPAFLLEPAEPVDERLPLPLDEGAVGINLSPLLAKYVAGWNVSAWAERAASIIRAVLTSTQRKVYLIPHVTGIDARHCDHSFLCAVARLVNPEGGRVFVVPDTLNAAETKWVIGKMAVFAGARTHSTIASLSMRVPTLSFGYSVKSRGINEDVYDHTRYCLQPNELEPNRVAAIVSDMLCESESIRRQLGKRMPQVEGRAWDAGRILKGILDAQGNASGGGCCRSRVA